MHHVYVVYRYRSAHPGSGATGYIAATWIGLVKPVDLCSYRWVYSLVPDGLARASEQATHRLPCVKAST